MPITIRLAPDRDLLIAECGAAIDRLEINVAMVEAMHTPGYAEGLPMLIDSRRLVELPSAGMLQDFADLVRRAAAPPGVRRAILTASAVGYGIARMLEAYTEGSTAEYRAFRSLREALEWLRPRRAGHHDAGERLRLG